MYFPTLKSEADLGLLQQRSGLDVAAGLDPPLKTMELIIHSLFELHLLS